MHRETPEGVRDRVWLPWAAAGLLFVLSLAMVWQIAGMARTQEHLREQVETLGETPAAWDLEVTDETGVVLWRGDVSPGEDGVLRATLPRLDGDGLRMTLRPAESDGP